MRIYWYWPFAREEEMAIAAALPRSGDHLTVHSMRRPGSPEPFESASVTVRCDLPEIDTRLAPPHVRWAANRVGTYLQRAWRRGSAIREDRPDLVHLLYLNHYTDGLDPLLPRGVPLVVDVHDVFPHHHRVPPGVERRFLARQYSRAEHVIVHHPWVRDRLADQFDVALDAISVVPLQVPRLAHAAATSSSDRPTLLMFGTLRDNKGLDVLVEALRQVADPDVRLIVAGRGTRAVEGAARAAAAADPRIELELGWVTPARKAELFSDATLVVQPYTSFESQSAVLNEAYALGVPVVVSDVGALGETVRADGTGWVVPAGSAVRLAESIQTALADGARRSAMAARAAAIADERAPEKVADMLRDTYDRVLASA